MASLSLDRQSLNATRNQQNHGGLVEQVEGLIKIYKNGHIERPPIVPNVPSNSLPSELRLTSKDVVLDRFTNLWARVYVPNTQGNNKLPLLVYFHGGGFCVGSAAWSCYHDFIANLASKAGCVVVSVNYRLAPENRLPAAYDDGFNSIMWVKQQAINPSREQSWWLSHCSLSNFFLAGDSAGANIAYNVALRIGVDRPLLRPLCHRGTILIQPFFGGEVRTFSEKSNQSHSSALTLSSADTYWRLALPVGANRDHPWCNPVANGAVKLRCTELPATMVCVSEMDILMDRNKEFCSAMVNAGKTVKLAVYKGVGHAFQILNSSTLSKARTQEMIYNLKAFIYS